MSRGHEGDSQGEKSKVGRPTRYTKKMAEEICSRIASGESLRSICKDESMPDKSNVFRWMISDSELYKGFRDQYTLARRIQAESLSDEIFDIADDGSNDYMEREDPENPGYIVNSEAIGRSRLRVDTRKWYLSKVLPKVYGSDKEEAQDIVVRHIMPVPVADSVDSWEESAKAHQSEILGA